MTPLRVEFHAAADPVGQPAQPQPGPPPPPPAPMPALGSASWSDGEIAVESDDPALKAKIERAFRRTPVVVDDPSLRYPSTHGELLLQPSDLEWFRAVAQVRVPAETGLVARFVPGDIVGGFDPAANYRRFPEQVRRLQSRPAAD